MSSIETHTPQIGVMLVDDQRVARTGFVLMLRKARGVNVIAEAENGQDTLDALAQRARNRASRTSRSWMCGRAAWTASKPSAASPERTGLMHV